MPLFDSEGVERLGALLIEFIQLGTRSELQDTVRRHPELMTDQAEAVFDALLTHWADSGAAALAQNARTHQRVLRGLRASRDGALAAATQAEAAGAGQDVGELTRMVAKWEETIGHPGFPLLSDEVRANMYISAGNAWFAHWRQRFVPADGLERALGYFRKAADAGIPSGAGAKARVNAAAALRERGGQADLDDAAGLLVPITTTSDALTRGIAWTTLGHVHFDRYGQSGDLRLLADAESAYRSALNDTPEGSAAEPGRLSHLAGIWLERWRNGGEDALLDAAVSDLLRAVAAARAHPDRLGVPLSHLGSALLERFRTCGNRDDLEHAVRVFIEAADSQLAGTVEKLMALANLAVARAQRHEVYGDPADAEEAATAFRQVSDDLERVPVSVASQVVAGLVGSYDLTGNTDSISEAIALARRAVASSPVTSLPALLDNLGSALSRRYDATGDVHDLNALVSTYEEAVACTPARSPLLAVRLANLGDALRDRALRIGTATDLDNAVATLDRALTLTPSAAPARADRLAASASALLDRHRARGRAGDLRGASQRAQAAAQATSPAAPDAPARLGLWAACLQEEGRLDEAVSLFTASLELTPATAPMYARHLHNLGQVLAERARHGGHPDEVSAAIGVLLSAWQAGAVADPAVAVSAGRVWGDLATSGSRWRQAAEGNLRALAAVAFLVGGQRVRRGKEGWLREAQHVPAAAAAALAHLKFNAWAVTVMETGRAVLLAEQLQRKVSGTVEPGPLKGGSRPSR